MGSVVVAYQQGVSWFSIPMGGTQTYKVSLDGLRGADSLTEWLLHLEEKRDWITDADLGNLVRAYADLITRNGLLVIELEGES